MATRAADPLATSEPEQAARARTPDDASRPVVRRSLRVGAANDPAEIDADRAADAVVRAIASPGPTTSAGTSRVTRAAAANVRRAPSDDVIRRKIAFTSSTFKSSTSFAADINGMFGKKSTFAQITQSLDRYHKTSEPTEEIYLLRAVYRLCDTWMTEHTGKKDDPAKRQELTRLRSQAVNEIVRIQNANESTDRTTPAEQQAYLNEVDDTRKGTGGFQYLTETGLDTADWMRGALDPTQQMPMMTQMIGKAGLADKNGALLGVMKRYGLTQAEMTAIGVYSAQDYIYVNPTVAGNDAWLESQMKNPKLGAKNPVTKKVLEGARNGNAISDDEKNVAKFEGAQHARMAMEGLRKLPKWSGTTYRGKGVTSDELARLSKPGASWKEDAFASSSQRRKPAEKFASEVSGGKVGVLMVLRMISGRDIAPLSFADEAEVLALPGATFRVAKTSKEKVGGAEIVVLYADQVL